MYIEIVFVVCKCAKFITTALKLYKQNELNLVIVRPGNGRWACQTEHCHSLSI